MFWNQLIHAVFDGLDVHDQGAEAQEQHDSVEHDDVDAGVWGHGHGHHDETDL